MRKKITLLVITLLLLYVNPSWAKIYYSYMFEGGGTDVRVTDNWMDEDGNSPSDFLNPSDEFHISSGEIMNTFGVWTVAGKVVIEEGAIFSAGKYDHSIKIDMGPDALYVISVPDGEPFSYDNLVLETLDISSTIRIAVSGVSNIVTLRTLNYPNLYLSGGGFILISNPTTVNGDLQIEGLQVNLTNTLTIGGSLYVNSGGFTVGGSNVLNVAGDLNIAGGTFSGKGTGAGSTTINVNGDLNISAGTFNGSSSSTAGSSAVYTINGKFHITGGTFNGVTASARSNTSISITGSFEFTGGTYNAKPNGTGTGLATITLNGTGDIIASSNMTNTNQIFTVSGNYGLQSNFTVSNELVLSSGNLNLNGHVLTINNALNIISGTLTGDNNSGITFGPASVGANLPAINLGTLTINRANQVIALSGNVTVAGTLTLSSGTLSINDNTLTLGGGISGSGVLQGGLSSSLIVNGSGTTLNLPSVTLQSLTLARPSGLILTGDLNVTETLYLTSGQLDNSSFNLTLGDGLTISKDLGEIKASPVFSGAVNLVYTGINAINSGYEVPANSLALNNITISKTGGTGLTLISDLEVNGTFTISNGGKLSAGVQHLTIKGNWVNNGTFNHEQSTVIFDGTTEMSGSVINTTFNNLTFALGATLTVPAGSNTTILGDVEVSGSVIFNHNNGTFTYGGSGSQKVAGLNYYNLVSTSSGERVLSGIIGIANTFTPGTNSYVTTGSTINYNGSGNQTLATFAYDNLALSNFGIKTPAGAILSVNDLTISGSAILEGNAKTINVAGNWSSYGSAGFSEVGSKVVFNGSSPQAIYVVGGEIFADFTMNGSSSVTLNSPTTITGILALTNGILISNGNLTIDLNTGSIGYNAIDAGVITGNLTIKKAINSNKTHYISCPLNGVTVADLDDDTEVFNSTNGGTRLYEYINGTWSPITSISEGLTPFNAYSLYFLAPTVLDYSGTYNHGDTPAPLSFPNSSSEFRMVGNPYPSTLNWNADGWTKTNLNNAIYFWDAASGNYASYVGGQGSNGGTEFIPPLQGFFVSTTGTGSTSSISMTNNVRTTSSNPSLWRKSNEEATILRLIAQNGALKDETVLRFTEDATELFDGNFDAYKLRNSSTNPNFFSVSNGVNYSINSLPFNLDATIPLKLEVPANGTYTIQVANMSGFDTMDVVLEDRLLNISHDLKSGGYSLAVSKGDTTTRLFLKFRKASIVTKLNGPSESKISVNSVGNIVNVYFPGMAEKEASVVFFNVIGEEVDRSENVNIAQGVFTKSLNVTTGIYILKIKVGNEVFTEKVYVTN